MSAELKSEIVDIDGHGVLLVSVKGGEAIIGTCGMGYVERMTTSLGNAQTRLFYIGRDPIISLIGTGHNKKNDLMISFCPGFQGYEDKINAAITAGFSKLNNGDSLLTSLRDLMMLLQDGVYALYLSDYYPTDGTGNFFWGAYNISHEFRGSAPINRVIGSKTYKPCFLVPSQPLDYYQTRTKATTDGEVKNRRVQGIVYHLSGLYSVLLKGHHGAVSCIDNNVPFKCAVIEKVFEPYTDQIEIERETEEPIQDNEAENANIPDENQNNDFSDSAEPVQEETPAVTVASVSPQHIGITGFRSPSLKIPLEMFPRDMLRQVIEGRDEYKPSFVKTISAKLGASRRKSISNNVLPYSVLEKSEKMPDVEMVESAYALSSLSDEQINCLLAGDVECNGKIIVSPNYYQSIVTACNYLQFTNESRFVDFIIAVMDNSELSAAHEYAARRTTYFTSNEKLYRFFKSAIDSGDIKYEKILPFAQTFVSRYKQDTAKS